MGSQDITMPFRKMDIYEASIHSECVQALIYPRETPAPL